MSADIYDNISQKSNKIIFLEKFEKQREIRLLGDSN